MVRTIWHRDTMEESSQEFKKSQHKVILQRFNKKCMMSCIRGSDTKVGERDRYFLAKQRD